MEKALKFSILSGELFWKKDRKRMEISILFPSKVENLQKKKGLCFNIFHPKWRTFLKKVPKKDVNFTPFSILSGELAKEKGLCFLSILFWSKVENLLKKKVLCFEIFNPYWRTFLEKSTEKGWKFHSFFNPKGSFPLKKNIQKQT